MDRSKKEIYLTFDDGPHPDVTPHLLEILSKYSAKVTFFQLGSKVLKHPDLHKLCLEQGHAVGNHGYDHLDAWRSLPAAFQKNVNKGKEVTGSQLYRPAYGRMPLMHKSEIVRNNKVIMWDVVSGDFDSKMNAQKCQEVIIKYAQNGSIIVLHENQKSRERVLSLLPDVLGYYSERGFVFSAIGEKVEANTASSGQLNPVPYKSIFMRFRRDYWAVAPERKKGYNSSKAANKLAAPL